MNRWTASALAVVMTGLVAVAPPAAAAASGQRPVITWQSCPTYSDEALEVMVPPGLRERFEQQLGRLECGTISVPLDHRRPRGRQITVALTRLPATDTRHRLGSLALNPGGPGGTGYLLPAELVTEGTAGELNDRYDLIGFDPRGVGYSSKADCSAFAPDTGPDPVGPITETAARSRYDAQAAANTACGRSDPAFLARLTTADVARDLDLIRAGLGVRHIGFLGVSWGTWLGVVYRSLFPGSVSRMFLDSVAIPDFSMVAFQDGRTAAAERNARRMTAWLAERHDRYGLGSTAGQVAATIEAVRRDYDTAPRSFTDLPVTLDGSFVAVAAIQDAQIWPLAGQVLKELREATGPTAPPTVKEVVGEPGPSPQPPADLPERANRTMNRAALCNEDPSRQGFDAAWAAYQQRLADNPLTGRAQDFSAGCAGWPLPVQTVQLEPGGGSLVLSGHRWETPSPYEWTLQTKAIVGGRVYTVDDDVHGSVMQEPACAADVVSYFGTGRIDGGCAGVPVPTDAALRTSAAADRGGFRTTRSRF